jgi:hypothetical protein
MSLAARTAGMSGAFPEQVQARDNARVPHITIHAFCESPDVAAAIAGLPRTA